MVTGTLAALDAIKREREERLPGWQLWYVPHASDRVAWCSRPWPLINAQTPEQLLAEITQAHAEAPADWPALAPIAAYAAIAPGIPEVGE